MWGDCPDETDACALTGRNDRVGSCFSRQLRCALCLMVKAKKPPITRASSLTLPKRSIDNTIRLTQACCLHWTRQRFSTFPVTSISRFPFNPDASSSMEENVESNRWHLTITGAVGGIDATSVSLSSTDIRACMICLAPGLMLDGSVHSSIRVLAVQEAGGSDLNPPYEWGTEADSAFLREGRRKCANLWLITQWFETSARDYAITRLDSSQR